jgi:hypothetical protein
MLRSFYYYLLSFSFILGKGLELFPILKVYHTDLPRFLGASGALGVLQLSSHCVAFVCHYYYTASYLDFY